VFDAPSTNSQWAWSWVEQQLTDAETYWVDVAGSGPRPHARPGVGVWLDTSSIRASERRRFGVRLFAR
jgi:hypothetical protein